MTYNRGRDGKIWHCSRSNLKQQKNECVYINYYHAAVSPAEMQIHIMQETSEWVS